MAPAPPPPVPAAPGFTSGVGAGSLYHIAIQQITESSDEAKLAARAMLRTLTTSDPTGCTDAQAIWQRISATENFGGEYGALDWLCTYVQADAAARTEITTRDADGARIVRHLDRVGWKRLEEYLNTRYLLQIADMWQMDHDQLTFLHELLRFNGPQRRDWEHTDDVVSQLGLTPGMAVADVGAGAGFLTYRFAKAVGPTGKVHALEISMQALAYLKQTTADEGLTNVEIVTSTDTDLTLPENSVDVVWICNLYHWIYGDYTEPERAAFLQSIHKALKPGGRLVISDQPPEAELPVGAIRYQGFSISSKLTIAQLEGAGFQLHKRLDTVPHRYVIEFVEKE